MVYHTVMLPAPFHNVCIVLYCHSTKYIGSYYLYVSAKVLKVNNLSAGGGDCHLRVTFCFITEISGVGY